MDRYMPQVDGVVLAHSDLKLLQTSGRIMYDSPYCHFWISVKLLVWRPVKGSTLCTSLSLFTFFYQPYQDWQPLLVTGVTYFMDWYFMGVNTGKALEKSSLTMSPFDSF